MVVLAGKQPDASAASQAVQTALRSRHARSTCFGGWSSGRAATRAWSTTTVAVAAVRPVSRPCAPRVRAACATCTPEPSAAPATRSAPGGRQVGESVDHAVGVRAAASSAGDAVAAGDPLARAAPPRRARRRRGDGAVPGGHRHRRRRARRRATASSGRGDDDATPRPRPAAAVDAARTPSCSGGSGRRGGGGGRARDGRGPRLQPMAGLAADPGAGLRMSSARRAIDYRTVAWGLGLQFLFALIVLKTDVGPCRLPDGRRGSSPSVLELHVRRVVVRLRSARQPRRVADAS